MTLDEYGNNEYDYQVIEVTGDGNCFYRALAVSFTGDQEDYMDYRQFVSKYYLEDKPEDIAFIPSD